MQLHILFVIGLFLSFCAPARAETDKAVYQVADILVDVSAANASLARDLALVQGQKQAFEVLMDRLGAKEQTAQTGVDQIAALVQGLEIVKEHASGSRYFGTFAVQFKPDAVRNFLSGKNVTYVEVRSQPVIILPILRSKGRSILWEEVTPWQTVWSDVAKKSALVPLVLPQADAEDAAKISAAEALAGNQDGLQAMMQKYAASSALVAVYTGDMDVFDGKTGGAIDLFRYDASGKVLEPSHIKVAPFSSAKAMTEGLSATVRAVVAQLEKTHRQASKGLTGPTSFLPIDVSVPTLAAWSQVRNKMRNVSAIADAHVITMTRGLVHAEIEFRGDISTLQQSMSQQGLTLLQGQGGKWELVTDGASATADY